MALSDNLLEESRKEVEKHGVRIVDGKKIVFVGWDTYVTGYKSPSMYSAARATGASAAFLLAEGSTAEDVTDDEIRAFLGKGVI